MNNKPEMYKIRKLQQWNSMPYKERSLYKVYKDIEDKCIAGDLPLVISETAQSYYLTINVLLKEIVQETNE